MDPDPGVTTNGALSRAFVLDGDRYPVENETFDACVSNYVLEHVRKPRDHFEEIHRVLKPGGIYVFRTPNRHHYVPLVASLTPHFVHLALANRLRNLTAMASDPHPTFYGVNTRRAVRLLGEQTGFAIEVCRTVEKEPSYGMSSRLLFFAFLAYERMVNASERAAGLRANIFAVLRKPTASSNLAEPAVS